jgi:hypothetical protein
MLLLSRVSGETKEAFVYERPVNEGTERPLLEYAKADYGIDAQLRRTPQEEHEFKTQGVESFKHEDGKVLADLPIGAGVDATKMDDGEAFASCRDGTLAIVRETSPGKFAIVQTLKTGPGAGTMGVDSITHKIYLPTAEYEEVKPGATGRPKTIPGTFKILLVAKHAAR